MVKMIAAVTASVCSPVCLCSAVVLGCVGYMPQLSYRFGIYRVGICQSHSLPGTMSLVRMHAAWLCPVDSCPLLWLFSVWPFRHYVVVALCDCPGAPRAF